MRIYRKIGTGALLLLFPLLVAAQDLPQTEKLSRGVVAVKMSKSEGQKKDGIFISWRFLETDKASTAFNVYRDGTKLNAEPLTTVTNYTDTGGSVSATYEVETLVDGESVERVAAGEVWENIYKEIPLNRPADSITVPYSCTRNKVKYDYPDGEEYSYTPNDCSVGDVDGDGDYEIIVKWDPSNSQDNSLAGYTGNVYLDCYEMDGTKLWRIDLGQNIRAGAHYTQFMVYDLDGDGKAEVACKTAPGTVDGEGNYVLMNNDDPNADYRNSSGYILSGPEYLTVFNGETGAELATVAYNPPRGSVSAWGDSYGNRVDRFLACIAYLDGVKPSLVMCRGYYTRTTLVAYDFDGKNLKQKWMHDSGTSSSGNTSYGQGNHNLSVGDVDDDGYDEIIYGACAIDHDGLLLYRTGLGHGDAIHFSDLDPNTEDLEVFSPHEDKSAAYGFEMHNARTGEILYGERTGTDVGRGIAADIDANYSGFEFWSTGSSNVYNCQGKVISSSGRPSVNFRIYWDGDLQDELLDGNVIDKWNPGNKKASHIFTASNYQKASTCNSTKKTPNLQADLFGDWREELVLWNGNTASSLLVFTTTYDSPYRMVTPMHDHIYRMGIAWQNVAYNQPPHLGYYIGDGPDKTGARLKKLGEGALDQILEIGEAIVPFGYEWTNADSMVATGLPEGVTAEVDKEKCTIWISGTPTKEGTYNYTLSTVGSSTDASQSGTIIVRKTVITEVAHFKFDETSGTTAKNEFSGSAEATDFTPEWTAGVQGGALLLPKRDKGYMVQPHYDAMKLGKESFSITLWFKSPGGTDSDLDWYLFHKGSHTADPKTGASGKWVGIQYRKNNLTFGIDDDKTKTNIDVPASDYFDNRWHFLACVRDVDSKEIIMYIDGERVGSTTDKTGDISETENMVIGNRNVLFDNPYQGALDELTISTGALSAATVKKMYGEHKEAAAGIDETAVSATERVNVYPTVVDDYTRIVLNGVSDEMATFVINNMAGAEVYNRSYYIEGGEPLVISGLGELPAGVYTLSVTTSDGTYTRKLVKK